MRLKSLKNYIFYHSIKGKRLILNFFLLSLQRVFSLTQREKK